jgi:hypothetical protein
MTETSSSNNNNNNNEVENGPIVMNVQCYDPERFPHVVVRGIDSNLSTLRGMDAQTRAAFFEERNANSVAVEAEAPALLVETPIPVTVKATVAAGGGGEGIFGGDVDDEDDNDNENCERELENQNATTPTPEELIRGELFVTNTQILFVAAEAEHASFDMAIGGACVVLHAMTEDPEHSVYLQLSTSDDADGGVTEVTLIPSSGEDDCQTLFDALCRLISLHPIEGDDDDDDMFHFGAGGMIGAGFGDDAFGDYGEADGSDGLVWAPPTQASAAVIDGTATSDDREAMLAHLDNLLVVPPGLEEDEDDGQFDDAE